MANSTITFYEVKFRRDTNPLVEYLPSYLSSIQNQETMNDFQYIRHGLNITINVNMSQNVVDNCVYNYVKIVNDDLIVYYYYIDNIIQIAPSTLSFELTMDTVNSLCQGGMELSPYNLNDSTEIIREHKDRFDEDLSNINQNSGTLVRKIDRASEDIICSTFDKENEIDITEENLEDADLGLKWYLIYHSDSESANTPLNISLCANREFECLNGELGKSYIIGNTIKYGDVNGTARTVNLLGSYSSYKYIYIVNNNNIPFKVNLSGTVKTYTNNIYNESININGNSYFRVGKGYGLNLNKWRQFEYLEIQRDEDAYCLVDKDNQNRECYLKYGTINTTHDETESVLYGNIEETDLNTFRPYNTHTYTAEEILRHCDLTTYINSGASIYVTTNRYHNISDIISNAIFSVSTVYDYIVESTTLNTIKSIDNIDRSDSKILKIVEYPYSPLSIIKYSGDNKYHYYAPNFEYKTGDVIDNQMLRVATSYVKFERDKFGKFDTEIYKLDISVPDLKRMNHNDEYESKKYHSDYYIQKLSYDSFNKQIEYERFDSIPESIMLDYKISNNMNSLFGFRINGNNLSYNDKEDYDKYLIINRNNELSLFHSAYLDYMRNGYNYDKKANDLAIKQQKTNAIMNTLSTAAKSYVGASLGESTPSGGAIAGAVFGAVKSAISIKQAEEQNALAMSNKLTQLENQAISVSDINDLDMLNWYNNNTLKVITYAPPSSFLSKLCDYLRLFGYKSSRYGVPNTSTRYWYNFIQCNADININNNKRYKVPYVNDVLNKYAEGITVFHRRPGITEGTFEWDLDQVYENWETWIVS